MATGKNISNKSASQRAIDKSATGLDDSGATVFLGMDAVTTQTTVGAAGGATAQPATPLGYFLVLATVNGVETLVKVPFHNP